MILSTGVVVLDLNNCVLTTNSVFASVDIANKAALTIIDSSLDKGGTIRSANPVILNNLGKLTVQNGNLKNICSNSIYTRHVISSNKLPDSTNDVSTVINGGSFVGSSSGYVVYVSNNTSASITGGTFSGGTYDIQSDASNILSFDEVTGTGPSFPGGITVGMQSKNSKSLSELLAAGAAYYNANGEPITLDDGATSIDGDVIVKREQ